MPVGREIHVDQDSGRRLNLARAVEVYQPAEDGRRKVSTGTGYLLDGNLVLTAAHVVRSGQTALVRLASSSTKSRCEVLWRRYDTPRGTGVDAALLRIIDPDFTPPAGLPRLRWGKPVTSEECPVEVIGFPAAMDVRAGSDDRLLYRDAAQVAGRIAPGSRVKAGRYEIRMWPSVPPVTPKGRKRRKSRWSGISGAGVCAGGLLVGIVVEDPDPSGGGLTAVPVESLRADPDFRRLVGEIWSVPVELDDLLERPVAAARSPIGLLRAEVAAVRFHGRDDIVAELHDWCHTPGEFDVRLVTGRAGEGKTRLGHELVKQSRRAGWCAGFLEPGCADERLVVLSELTEPLLLVVDYAEGRLAQLVTLIRLMERGSRHAGSAYRVRVLLLARATGGWWESLCANTRFLRGLAPDSVLPLPELQPTSHDQVDGFREAVVGLRSVLADRPGYEGAASVEPGQIAPLSLGHPRFGHALTLQMAALSGLLQYLAPVDTTRGEPLEEILLRHEARFWEGTTPVHGLSHLHRATLRQLVTAATLCPVATATEALDLLRHLTALSGETANTRTAVANWLHELYASASRYWDALVPDALGEYLVGMVGVEFNGLLDDLAGYVDRHQAEHMLTVLCRALIRFPALNDNVVRYVVSRPRPMAFAAIEIAVRGDHPVLTDALDRLVASSSVDARLLGDLLEDTPRSTITLARWAVQLATRLVDSRGPAPSGDGEHKVVALADAEYQLAFRLAQLGRHGEALTHAMESVRLHRAAVEQYGDEPDGLAESLLVQAARLAKLGRRTEAIEVADEAVRLCRTLNRKRGVLDDRVRLAHALHHQAMWLHDNGDHAGAVSIGEEALHIRAQLVDASPRFRASLAISTMNFACYLHDAGRSVDGLPHARAAVDVYRALADESPDAYRAALGLALTNLATLLAALEELDEALTQAEQAVSSYRQVIRPDTADPLLEEFTIAVANYGRRLAASGRPRAAIDAFTEAEELCLRLASGGLPAATNRLATVRRDLRVLRQLTDEHPAAK